MDVLSFRIDMYTEGMADLFELFIKLMSSPTEQRDAAKSLIKDRAKNRFFPAFEKVSESA